MKRGCISRTVSEDGVIRATDEAERRDAFDVREAVFVVEQGISADLEYDEHDDPDADARHFVAYDDGRPVGAARLRTYEPGVGKVERVAVRSDVRGEGWGRRLMTAVREVAKDSGHDRLRLHAQVRVSGFYDALGYETVDGPFEEAGIPHVAMVLELDE